MAVRIPGINIDEYYQQLGPIEPQLYGLDAEGPCTLGHLFGRAAADRIREDAQLHACNSYLALYWVDRE